ncbi:MAG: UvrD-helicase domain-containing protein [Clostridia bacterium]|nr:UvrD-helicase domain-containing protein [Clostridia bacterium]
MDYESLLNEQQLKPVYALEGPVLVLAGAGSGKTRVLTYRIANLIEKGVSPYSILAITFTNKAAKEMQDRIENVTGIRGAQISTFHSFCTKVLRQDIEALGVYTKNFSIYDDEDSTKIVTRLVKAYNLDDDKKNIIKEIRSHISYAKNYGFDPGSYASKIRGIPRWQLIIKAYQDYQDELIRNNALDFDDLLLLVLKLFAERKDILEKYQERYKYIHVDEFQDTNKIQYMILRLLGYKYANVFVVGDDDQSIYGWRGADYTNIKKFVENFPGCKTFKLDRNYRSTKQILDVANKVIRNNKERMGKELWTDKEGGVKVEYKKAWDELEEADYVLSQINMLKRNSDYEDKDFAILVRTSSITRPFEEKCNLYNIPYRLIGGHKFYERKEIKDFLAYLKIVTNPKDSESILRVINVPKRGIGDSAIEKFKEACDAKKMTLFDGLQDLSKLDLTTVTKNKLMNFAAIVNDLYAKRDLMDLDSFIDYVYETIDFASMYDVDVEEDKDRLDNLSELITVIKNFIKDNPESTLDEFLQSVTLQTSEDDQEKLGGNVLTIATVHGVKGLEFRCVFVVGLEDGIFPIRRMDTTTDEIEEERRIMYVAITRAKERLYLTQAQQRYRFGQKNFTTPSIFLKEADMLKTPTYDDDDVSYPKKKLSYGYTSTFASKPTPSFAEKKEIKPVSDKDLTQFKVGQIVEHTKFGKGEIISISGENADIKFEGLGVKKFNLRLAPISVVK